MAETTCRIVPHSDASGPGNMARDEALLDLVAADPSAAAFRTYGWTEPTLSLGYFQSIHDAESDPRWQGAPLVRRPTGGGALWHDREITYAVVVPRDHPLARRTRDLYHAVHAAIAGLLQADGLAAGRRGDREAAPDAKPFLCFADRDPEDVVAGAAKVVGSAQRRRAGAVLQHGSVLLAASPRTPELPGAADLGPVPIDPADWAARLAGAIVAALGLTPAPQDWPEAALARADALEREVYRSASWTRRR